MSKRKGNNSNSLNNLSNNSDKPNNSVNQLLMPTLQPYRSGLASHCYTTHKPSILLPKFSGDPQELNFYFKW